MFSIINSLFYVFFYCIIVLFSGVYKEKKIVEVNLFFDISIDFLFCFFIGFRGLLFSDWVQYVPAYNKLPSIELYFLQINDLYPISNWERGFTFIMSLSKTISSNYIFFQTSLFIVEYYILKKIFKFYLYDKYYLCFPFFFLFGCIQITVNFLRQGLATIIFIYAIKYIYEKKLLKYIGLILVATLFHRSAFLYFPFYLILNRKYSTKLILTLFVIGNIIYLLQINYISSIIWNLAQRYGGILGIYAGRYLHSSVYGKNTGFTLGFFERFLTFYFVLRNRSQIEEKLPRGLIIENIIYIYLFIFLYLSEIYVLIERLPFMFIFSYWIIFPFLLLQLKPKRRVEITSLISIYGILKIAMSYRHVTSLYNHGIKYIYNNSILFGL